MKKGGGIGPTKPWQPACSSEKVPNPLGTSEKISLHLYPLLRYI